MVKLRNQINRFNNFFHSYRVSCYLLPYLHFFLCTAFGSSRTYNTNLHSLSQQPVSKFRSLCRVAHTTQVREVGKLNVISEKGLALRAELCRTALLAKAWWSSPSHIITRTSNAHFRLFFSNLWVILGYDMLG